MNKLNVSQILSKSNFNITECFFLVSTTKCGENVTCRTFQGSNNSSLNINAFLKVHFGTNHQCCDDSSQ